MILFIYTIYYQSFIFIFFLGWTKKGRNRRHCRHVYLTVSLWITSAVIFILIKWLQCKAINIQFIFLVSTKTFFPFIMKRKKRTTANFDVENLFVWWYLYRKMCLASIHVNIWTKQMESRDKRDKWTHM